MKRIIKNICVTFVCIAFLTSFQMLSAGYASDPHEDLILEFIQNALPIDISKYDVTLTRHGNTSIVYALKAEQSVLALNCYIKNNILGGCNLYVKNGSIIYDKPYANITEVAIGFLEKYQTYIKHDSTEIINTLTNVDTTNNSTETVGNVKLIVTAKDPMGTKYTNLEWKWTVEGVDYPMIRVTFENETLYGFSDSRGIYTIGDTTVNTSKEQAINAAMEYLKTYSYVVGDYHVSGFDVVEDRTVAKLTCGIRNSSVLYPMWHVILFLDHTYPGSINAFQIVLWAKSGEVFGIGDYTDISAPPKYYDPSMDPNRDEYSSNQPLNLDASNWSLEKSSPNSPLNTYLVIAAVALTIIAMAVAVFIKRCTRTKLPSRTRKI